MRFTPDNFLQLIKQIVTGGGKLSVTPFGTTTPQASSLQPVDGGINLDMPLALGDATLGTGTTLTTDAQGLHTLSEAASGSNLTVGTWGFVIPRDYDQATDKFRIRISAAMNGTTDTPVLTVASSTLLPAGTLTSTGTLNSTATLVAGTVATGSTVTALNPMTISSTVSSVQSVFEFELSGQGFFRDQVVSLKLTSGSHTTNTLQIYSISVVYASCIVAFTDDYLGSDPADLAGNDAFNNPLR